MREYRYTILLTPEEGEDTPSPCRLYRPSQPMEAFEDGRFTSVICPLLLDERGDVLARPRIQRRLRTATEAIDRVWNVHNAAAVKVAPTRALRLRRDPDDVIAGGPTRQRGTSGVSRSAPRTTSTSRRAAPVALSKPTRMAGSP